MFGDYRIGSAPGSSFLSGWVVGGQDGLRPEHLKELVLCRESGSDFLGDLTAFVNMVLAGSCPKDIAPYFFGGRLLALSKKSGGLRPIAIGLTLRRLVSKCASSFGSKRLASVFVLVSLAWAWLADARRLCTQLVGFCRTCRATTCW